MSQFNLDFFELSKTLIPIDIRKTKLMAFVSSLINPIGLLKALFDSNREANLYRLSHTSQVVHLEAVLNDAFDNTLRRIEIADTDDIDPTYIYKTAELKPRYIYKQSEPTHTYIRRTAETAINGPDFLVLVPAAITFDVARMKALINEYRLASKSNYTITIV